MRFVWATSIKDLRRRLRDPLALVLWIGIPLIIGTLLTLLSGGKSGPRPEAFVLVADEDDSLVSGLLVGALSQDRTGGLVRAEAVDAGEGRARLDGGEASALLVIPDGFGGAILRDEPTTLQLIKNPAETILPSIVEEMLTMAVDAVFYAQRIVGDDVRATFEAAGVDSMGTDTTVSAVSIRINDAVSRLEGTLIPPVMDLVVRTTDDLEEAVGAGEDAASGPPMALLFVPGLLFMALLFMAQGLSNDLWTERGLHTLRRLSTTPQSATRLLAGKLAAGITLMTVVASVTLVATTAYFELGWSRLPLAIAWAALSGLLLLLVMTTLTVISSTQRDAEVLGMVVVLPLMMLGGSFFPFEAMPDLFATIGKLTPNGWALARLKDILFDRVDAAAMGVALGALLCVIVLLFVFSAWRLDTRFMREA